MAGICDLRSEEACKWTDPQQTPNYLKSVGSVASLERSDRHATMLWAAATVCFFGFLRVGEIVAYLGSGFDSSIHLSV